MIVAVRTQLTVVMFIFKAFIADFRAWVPLNTGLDGGEEEDEGGGGGRPTLS